MATGIRMYPHNDDFVACLCGPWHRILLWSTTHISYEGIGYVMGGLMLNTLWAGEAEEVKLRIN